MTNRLQKAAAFDFDGSLSDTRLIRYLVANPWKKYWDEFYARTPECPPNVDVVRAAQQKYAEGYAILIVTGRQLCYNDVTFDAVQRFNVPCNVGFFRNDGDYRPAHVIKLELLDEALEDGYDVQLAWDDDPRIIKAYQKRGLETTLVPGWDEPIAYPDEWLAAHAQQIG